MSTKLPFPPHPDVIISDKTYQELPLRSFEILILVEPDPETWVPDVLRDDFTDAPWEFQSQMMEDEYVGEDSDDEPVDVNPELILPEDPLIVWVRRDIPFSYYANLITQISALEFKYPDYSDIPETFTIFFNAYKTQNKRRKVAVFGAVFEDEVIRVANAMQEMGYQTTILTRYCLSGRGFTNIEDIQDYRSDAQKNNEE